jgi:undecaprenyl pyrophosphate synthase
LGYIKAKNEVLQMENKRDALTLRCDGIRLVYEMQELESAQDAVEALTGTILSGICRLAELADGSTYEIRQAIKESYNKIIADTSLFERSLNHKIADDEALIADKKDYELALTYGPSVEVNGLGVD